LRFALRVGISCKVLKRVWRGTGKSELGLCIGSCPIVIVLCLGLGLKVWFMKSRKCANHVRWGLSGINRTGTVRMTCVTW
jgi:hypothetical protein